MRNYRGTDLSKGFKDFFAKEKKRLTQHFKAKGCTNIQLSYGFYYFSGFMTSPTGQVYYISSSDVRHFPYEKLLIRTAKDYNDYTGGSNQYVKTDKESILNFNMI